MRKPYLFAAAAVLFVAGSATASNRPDRAESPQGGTAEIASGTMEVEVVNGCYMVFTGTVTTNPVGGTVPAYINTWDDGTHQAAIALGPFPADGGTHAYVASYQQPVPVLQGAFGLGTYLEDAAGLAATFTFDAVTVDVSDVCTGPAPDISGFDATAIPTLGRVGLIALVGLVGLAALALMVRRRAASRG
jgi:hypothetical protein